MGVAAVVKVECTHTLSPNQHAAHNTQASTNSYTRTRIQIRNSRFMDMLFRPRRTSHPYIWLGTNYTPLWIHTFFFSLFLSTSLSLSVVLWPERSSQPGSAGYTCTSTHYYFLTTSGAPPPTYQLIGAVFQPTSFCVCFLGCYAVVVGRSNKKKLNGPSLVMMMKWWENWWKYRRDDDAAQLRG